VVVFERPVVRQLAGSRPSTGQASPCSFASLTFARFAIIAMMNSEMYRKLSKVDSLTIKNNRCYSEIE